jgi:bacterial leucyl aminopeptidase
MTTTRFKIGAWLSGLSALAMAGAAQAQLAPAGEQEMYITIEQKHVTNFQTWQQTASIPTSARFKLPVLETNEGIVLSRVPESKLPLIGEYMHSGTPICGGYFAFGTLEEAQKFLQQTKTAALNAQNFAVINYTVDNQAFVNPLLAQVSGTNIVSTITALSNNTVNRWFNGAPGRTSSMGIATRWRNLVTAAGRTDITVTTPACANCGMQPNVLLTIPGSDLASEVVVLGAHADSIAGRNTTAATRAPGADDDASGVATLTEALRVVLAANYRPRRTVQMYAYAAEEVGLRGSRDAAQKALAANTNVVGVLNLDLTAFRNPNASRSIYVLTDNVNASLTAFLRTLHTTYLAPTGLAQGDTACGYACSDHASWTQAGFPAAMYVEGTFAQTNQNIHSANDTVATSGGNAAVGTHTAKFAKLAIAFMAEVGKGGRGR